MPRKLIFYTVIVSFLAFPFLYFSFMLTHLSFFETWVAYPVILLTGLAISFFSDRKAEHDISSETQNTLSLFSVMILCGYAAFLFLMMWSRYASYISEAVDVSYFHQVIWQLSEFKIPYIWALDQRLYPAWSQHFSPILILIAPVYWLVKNAGLLMSIQALAVISGAYPVYRIAKSQLKSKYLGLALSFSYLAFGGLQFGFAYGFHEIMFFPPLFFWMYYFYVKRKVHWYYLFLILSLFVKEEVAFIIIFWGIYLLFIKKDLKHGAITSALGILWYVICFHIVFPLFTGGNDFVYWGQYTSNGGVLGIVQFALFHPFAFLKTLVSSSEKIDTILQVFGSFSFLVILFPPSLIIIAPSLLEKLLSSGIAMANGAHYSAAITAVVLVAVFESIPYIFKYRIIKEYIRNKQLFFSVLIGYIAYFSNILYGYAGFSLVPKMHTSITEIGPSAENNQLLSQIIGSIPDKATVAAQYQIAPHIHKHYKKVSIWPTDKPKEDFIIVDTQLRPVMIDGRVLNTYLEALDKNKAYELTVNQLGIVVFKKKSFKP